MIQHGKATIICKYVYKVNNNINVYLQHVKIYRAKQVCTILSLLLQNTVYIQSTHEHLFTFKTFSLERLRHGRQKKKCDTLWIYLLSSPFYSLNKFTIKQTIRIFNTFHSLMKQNKGLSFHIKSFVCCCCCWIFFLFIRIATSLELYMRL